MVPRPSSPSSPPPPAPCRGDIVGTRRPGRRRGQGASLRARGVTWVGQAAHRVGPTRSVGFTTDQGSSIFRPEKLGWPPQMRKAREGPAFGDPGPCWGGAPPRRPRRPEVQFDAPPNFDDDAPPPPGRPGPSSPWTRVGRGPRLGRLSLVRGFIMHMSLVSQYYVVVVFGICWM